jgi:dolichyl-phosphate beta-glucosyltransferase
MQPRPDIRLSVVIPAFNEELRLPQTLESVTDYLAACDYGAEVLVVDDGSTDGTAQLVRDWPEGEVPVRLVAHPDGTNHGKGATVRRGFGVASGAFRLFMDADNSTTIDHVESFWTYLESGYDVVIGSRDVQGADVVVHQSWYKEIGGKLGNLVIQFLAAPGISDTQAGFKMFSARCIEELLPLLSIARWGFDVELIVAARQRGYEVKEVPIRWVDSPNSKVPAIAYLQVLAEVWRVRKLRKAGAYDRK